MTQVTVPPRAVSRTVQYASWGEVYHRSLMHGGQVHPTLEWRAKLMMILRGDGIGSEIRVDTVFLSSFGK